MIPAKKSPWFTNWFARRVQKRIEKMFSKVFIRGLDQLKAALSQEPVLAISNHTSYWDPMMVILMAYPLLKTDGYAMMDATNLRRLPFLGRVGGFGVDLDDTEDRSRSVAYAAELLTRPDRLVWIFPEGRERSPFAEIDDFKPGAAVIAKRAPRAKVFPVGLRYVFGSRVAPEAYISVGASLGLESSIEESVKQQQRAVSEQLGLIADHLSERSMDEDFQVVSAKPRSKMNDWAETILARLTRY